MKLSALFVVSTCVVWFSCAEAAPPSKSYYNRRAYPPPNYFYGHKGGFNAGPPIHKYRPPGFRATRNPYIGPGPNQGFHHQPLIQGGPQGIIHPGQPQGLHQNPQHLIHQGQQLHHQGQPQGLPQRVPQGIHPEFNLGVHQGAPQVLHQGHHQEVYQGIQHSVAPASPHPGHPYQQVSQQPQVFQSLAPKRLTPAPPNFSKTQVTPQYTPAPWKSQPSHLNSIKGDFINEAASFTAATKTYYKPNDERSPIHTIPAPKLSAADKPADFEARIQQQAIQKLVLQQQALQQQALQQQAAEQQATQQLFSTTPRFKTLDNTIADKLKNNPAALLAHQTQSQFAPDPDPQNVPQVRVPPTNDPFSQPSNRQVPIDIYLQQQIDNEIAQQESLYIQQQKAQEARQYQQQIEAAQQMLAQQQAFHAHQENLKQQILQHQALEAQKQLALQAQQQAALQQQAVLEQQQQFQQLPVQQQPAQTLTAEELFNLMHGLPTSQANSQPSTQSVQDVLAKPQNQNEIAGTSSVDFQPNYQSFKYDEKAHQQKQVNQNESLEKAVDSKRSTSEHVPQTNLNPQYQNFNYDEKTKRNGFNNDGSDSEQSSQNHVNKIEVSTNRNELKDIKKEKRYQKHAFNANNGYTVGYSTLPKEVTESNPQVQYNHHQGGYSVLPVNYNEKQLTRKLKPDNSAASEIKKVHAAHLKKKHRLPNNGYSTIAEDLLQQHDLKNDLQQLTYSTLPNKKIIEVLKKQMQVNSTQQIQDPQILTTEKNNLQKMRENAQKFYNPHIIQSVRNNTSNENVQIQQSIQIYENNYASKGDDNHIDLSGITTTSTTVAASPVVSSTTEPTIVTEINVIENKNQSDSENQESNLYEEIMLQDESKPLEDHYNSNSHSYFGQRIRPKRT